MSNKSPVEIKRIGHDVWIYQKRMPDRKDVLINIANIRSIRGNDNSTYVKCIL